MVFISCHKLDVNMNFAIIVFKIIEKVYLLIIKFAQSIYFLKPIYSYILQRCSQKFSEIEEKTIHI